MKKLYINRFAAGGGDEGFSVTVSYEPHYGTGGACTSVTVTLTGGTFGGITDLQGNDISSQWVDPEYGFPTGTLSKTYYQNTTEDVICENRYHETATAYIEVTQIGGGSDPEPENPNPEYELFNELLYGWNETLPLSDVVIGGKHIAEIWYNGKMFWGYREVDPTTKPFNFTIDEVQYTATPGMTWSQWKQSSYGQSTEYDIYNNYVENWRGNRVYRMNPTLEYAMGTSEIARNGQYYCNM